MKISELVRGEMKSQPQEQPFADIELPFGIKGILPERKWGKGLEGTGIDSNVRVEPAFKRFDPGEGGLTAEVELDRIRSAYFELRFGCILGYRGIGAKSPFGNRGARGVIVDRINISRQVVVIAGIERGADKGIAAQQVGPAYRSHGVAPALPVVEVVGIDLQAQLVLTGIKTCHELVVSIQQVGQPKVQVIKIIVEILPESIQHCVEHTMPEGEHHRGPVFFQRAFYRKRSGQEIKICFSAPLLHIPVFCIYVDDGGKTAAVFGGEITFEQ